MTAINNFLHPNGKLWFPQGQSGHLLLPEKKEWSEIDVSSALQH
jgi:hypothetical protein